MDNKYLENSIHSLVQLLGVHDSAPVAEYISLIRTGQVKECIESIAQYLRLPIKVNLLYVSPEDIGHTQFQSTGLVHTDSSGRGVGGITAQVLIPPDLPMYGSDRFRNMTFTVKISNEATSNPQTFIGVMAHELTHVVLYSLWYKDKENEVHTDIAAMLLGFADAMKHGRKVVTEETPFLSANNSRKTTTTTYGYLNDSEFDYVHYYISGLIKARETKLSGISREINNTNIALKRLTKEIVFFEKWLPILGKRGNLKMIPTDSQKIMQFYYPGFTEDIKTKAAAIKKFTDGINIRYLQPHKPSNQESIRDIKETLEANRISCQRIVADMVRNNKLIKKYLSLKNQVAISITTFFRI